MPQQNQRYVYIVISQTGTLLSRLLKIITGSQYNHASLSLLKDLQPMYSFGRMQAYNPFWGGFVQESIYFGTFKRFKNTEAVVAEVPVDEECYQQMQCFLDKMYQERKNYHYNYLGLFLAGVKKQYCSQNTYYCSEFVRDILIQFEIAESSQFSPIVQPMDLLQEFQEYIIYTGKLKNYNYAIAQNG